MSKSVTLANGVEMPIFGSGVAFGNWSDAEKPMGFVPEDAWFGMKAALDAGVRHLDGALMYSTHGHIREVLAAKFMAGELKRDDVWITTKMCHPPLPAAAQLLFGNVPPTNLLDFVAEVNKADGIEKTLTEQMLRSLDELGVGKVDLLLVHWPGPFEGSDYETNRACRIRIWKVYEGFLKKGMTRAIGVSNWTEKHLMDLKADGATVTPHVNQIEMSPYTIYSDIVAYCKENNIALQAYSPLGSSGGGVLKDPLMVELAAKYSKNPGQLALRWLVQQGVVVLPRSTSKERLASNMDIYDFEISTEDMDKITALNKGKTITNTDPYSIP